ncbi:MAG: ABC transporter permease subunit [Planctomycetes bacterium]|nr:ABC transporter permease subunit [Planctomycetota bacterium]
MAETAHPSTASAAPPLRRAPKPLSLLRRRWRKFRALKRGWYSFLILTGAYALSFFLPVLVNSRALIVKCDGRYYFPAVGKFHEAKAFGQRLVGEADYRKLKRQFEEEGRGNWVILPPYPYHPHESLLTDPELPGNPPHPPSRRHWMGTDDRGRDVFARLLYGFQISITFGIAVVGLSYLIGMAIGACLGYFGGRIDLYGQRLVEIWSNLPFLYIIMIIGSLMKPDMSILIAILAIFSWISISFYMRGEFYREKSKDYAAAAISQGESNLSVMFRHLLPNGLTPVISFAPFSLVGAISSLVALDFLGFGLRPPTPSWGELVNQGLQNIFKWHLVVFPLGAMFATLLLVVFIGEAIREAFDPKSHSRLR